MESGAAVEVLLSMLDDWCDVASVMQAWRNEGITDEASLRECTAGVIALFLHRDLVVAGDLGPSGFIAWETPATDALQRILSGIAGWLGDPINPGAIAWLALTARGRELAMLLQDAFPG